MLILLLLYYLSFSGKNFQDIKPTGGDGLISFDFKPFWNILKHSLQTALNIFWLFSYNLIGLRWRSKNFRKAIWIRLYWCPVLRSGAPSLPRFFSFDYSTQLTPRPPFQLISEWNLPLCFSGKVADPKAVSVSSDLSGEERGPSRWIKKKPRLFPPTLCDTDFWTLNLVETLLALYRSQSFGKLRFFISFFSGSRSRMLNRHPCVRLVLFY